MKWINYYKFVFNRFCADQPKPNPLEKWCYIDCPVDCALEGWSPWNASCSCNDTGDYNNMNIKLFFLMSIYVLTTF